MVVWSKRFGRKKKLQANDVTALLTINKKKPKTSLRKLSIELQAKANQSFSYSTIKRTLNNYNIRAFTPIKKPLLSKKIFWPGFRKVGNFYYH